MARGVALQEVPVMDGSGPQFAEKEVVDHGTTYRLRELSSKKYDELYKKSDIKGDGDPDTVMLLRLMLIEALQEPKLTGDQIADLPFRLVNKLSRACNDLHFGDEPDNEDPKAV